MLKDRVLTAGDVIGPAARAGPAVGIATGKHGALHLHEAFTLGRRNPGREGEDVVAGMAPQAIFAPAVAGLVPALHEIVVDVGDRGTGELEIDVVALPFARMAGLEGGESGVDAADKGNLGWLSSIDQPDLLVLAIRSMRLIPAGAEA